MHSALCNYSLRKASRRGTLKRNWVINTRASLSESVDDCCQVVRGGVLECSCVDVLIGAMA